jgi:hypothetical protein
MIMKPPEGSAEPAVTSWQSVSVPELLDRLGLPDRASGNRVILVDGRSGGGKTTLAARLQAALAGSVVVHTDDIVIHAATFFDWDSLLIENMIAPVRRNEPVRYRQGLDGAIAFEAGRDLIVEGVGAGRASVAAWADAVIWVQSDFAEATARGLARDLASGVRDAAGTEGLWDEFTRSELPFLEADQPWQRATVIVAGRPAGEDSEGSIDIAV